MADWMRSLAEHYARCRVAHPEDHLLVVFDIDGTILDVRHLVRRVLSDFDHVHDTHLFDGLRVEDIDVHENEVETLLDRRHLSAATRDDVLAWYHTHRWAPDSVRLAHRPYDGVFDVIRWFQIQCRTSVALNTGRPETLRDDTLDCLNALGRDNKVTFTDELLFMNPHAWEADVVGHKVAGIRHFQQAGYRVVAAVDNEPEIIGALVAADTSHEILFLHAQTLYRSPYRPMPRTVGGSTYDITSLVAERDLPRRVDLVWHGVNDDANLRQFLASPVRWAEVDVRRHPRGPLVLRHDAFDPTKPAADGPLTNGSVRALRRVDNTLDELREAGKGVKIDIKEAEALDDLLAVVARSGLGDEDLWFNGRLDVLGEDGILAIHAAHPGATIQCPIDFIGPLVIAMPDETAQLLRTLRSWGISRFSVAWAQGSGRDLLERLDCWGYEVNLYAVDDLEQFLRAALMLPRSIAADFNFPQWHYFGRGAGHDGRHHRYSIDTVPPAIDVA